MCNGRNLHIKNQPLGFLGAKQLMRESIILLTNDRAAGLAAWGMALLDAGIALAIAMSRRAAFTAQDRSNTPRSHSLSCTNQEMVRLSGLVSRQKILELRTRQQTSWPRHLPGTSPGPLVSGVYSCSFLHGETIKVVLFLSRLKFA